MPISPLHDAETKRQQRNLTQPQKRTNSETREGVLVNNLIKDCPTCEKVDLTDTMDTLVISKNTKLPEKLYEKDKTHKSLLPISAISLGVMGAITGIAGLIHHSSKVNLTIDSLKRVPPTVRNVAINDETFQALYRIIECPNYKTIQAGVGVFALTAMAFMGKTFFDGFKEVWVKKKEADIQKNLQERLIDIETQSFSGKIQITRSMLSQKAIELGRYLNVENAAKSSGKLKVESGKFGAAKQLKRVESGKSDNFQLSTFNFQPDISLSSLAFCSSDKVLSPHRPIALSPKENKFQYFLLGLSTAIGIAGLGFLSLKLLTKSKGHLEKFIKDTKNEITKVVKNSTEKSKNHDMANLENLFKTVESSEDEIREFLKPLNWSDKEDFIKRISKEINKSTVDANIYCGGGKTPKPTFYSHVNDYRAFLYNYLLDTENKQFRALFLGTTGLTAVGYGGKLAGDAIKEVQVKKYNADTEAELQQRLVSTELKNFKSKKDSAIQPLMEEFYKQARAGKPKEELKVMAENILLEINNGPPYVYA